uniref:SCP domain-containing protein n=1 Tax=Timema douglasi TaxID=61478 RepID=A0A7R8VBE9_TIMDO|nr:unnamed protein product [Timema douglasi]
MEALHSPRLTETSPRQMGHARTNTSTPVAWINKTETRTKSAPRPALNETSSQHDFANIRLWDVRVWPSNYWAIHDTYRALVFTLSFVLCIPLSSPPLLRTSMACLCYKTAGVILYVTHCITGSYQGFGTSMAPTGVNDVVPKPLDKRIGGTGKSGVEGLRQTSQLKSDIAVARSFARLSIWPPSRSVVRSLASQAMQSLGRSRACQSGHVVARPFARLSVWPPSRSVVRSLVSLAMQSLVRSLACQSGHPVAQSFARSPVWPCSRSVVRSLVSLAMQSLGRSLACQSSHAVARSFARLSVWPPSPKHLEDRYLLNNGTCGGACAEQLLSIVSRSYSVHLFVIRQQLTNAEKEALVNIHNTYRSKVARGLETRGSPGPQPSASNMRMMIWNNELATIAQTWANQCAFGHDACRKTCGGSQTGHYTQVVWANTYQVGCGYIKYQVGSTTYNYVVCNYGPSGNYVGQELYKTGAACSQCGTMVCDTTYPGLCR